MVNVQEKIDGNIVSEEELHECENTIKYFANKAIKELCWKNGLLEKNAEETTIRLEERANDIIALRCKEEQFLNRLNMIRSNVDKLGSNIAFKKRKLGYLIEKIIEKYKECFEFNE